MSRRGASCSSSVSTVGPVINAVAGISTAFLIMAVCYLLAMVASR